VSHGSLSTNFLGCSPFNIYSQFHLVELRRLLNILGHKFRPKHGLQLSRGNAVSVNYLQSVAEFFQLGVLGIQKEHNLGSAVLFCTVSQVHKSVFVEKRKNRFSNEHKESELRAATATRNGARKLSDDLLAAKASV